MKSYTIALFLFIFGILSGVINQIYATEDEVYLADPEYNLTETQIKEIMNTDNPQVSEMPQSIDWKTVFFTATWAVLNVASLLYYGYNIPWVIAWIIQAPIYYVFAKDMIYLATGRRMERI
jgi:hypothetical protein